MYFMLRLMFVEASKLEKRRHPEGERSEVEGFRVPFGHIAAGLKAWSR
jgi:hypothetical protein